jgi:hypothetical protein
VRRWRVDTSLTPRLMRGGGLCAIACGGALCERVRAGARRVSGCKPRAVTRHRRARRWERLANRAAVARRHEPGAVQQARDAARLWSAASISAGDSAMQQARDAARLWSAASMSAGDAAPI